MAASQRPVAHWSLPNDQLSRPELFLEGTYNQEYFSLSPPKDLTAPNDPSQNEARFPASDLAIWNSWHITQPSLDTRNPDLFTLSSPLYSPILNETPASWDWAFGDKDSMSDISMSSTTRVQFTPSVSNYPMNDRNMNARNMKDDTTTNGNTPIPDDESSISSLAHGYLLSSSEASCQQCGLQFINKASLNVHSKQTCHSPYLCKCKATFSRLDVLDRHIQAYTSEASIACPYCQTNPKSFGRRDHLTQHLRGFHNMEIVTDTDNPVRVRPMRKLRQKIYCLHDDCWDLSSTVESHPQAQRRRRSFQTQGHYTSHLREVHDESLFPCTAKGCARKGGRGFFRNGDLLKHTRDHHSRSPS